MDLISKLDDIPPIIDRFAIASFTSNSKVSIRRTNSRKDMRLRVYIDSTFVGRLSEKDNQKAYDHLQQGKEIAGEVIHSKYRYGAQISIKLHLLSSIKVKSANKKSNTGMKSQRSIKVTHDKRAKVIARELEWLGEVPGIYRIYNSGTNKSYIGQSCNLKRRLITEHLYVLTKGKHTNLSLQHDWIQKPSNIHFEILAFNVEVSCLDELEAKYIQLYNSHAYGYNKTFDGKGVPQDKDSETAEIEFCYANRREIEIE